MASAIPLAVSAGTSLYNKFKNRGASPTSTTGSQGILNEGLTSARQARDQGGSLFGIGAPLLQSASNYWQKLINGNPASMNEAVAPERQAINENYLGAERGLDAGPLRGGSRDYAMADLERQKAGQIGGLYPAARLAAAQAGGSLGLSTAGAGTTATANAGNTFSTLYGGAERGREFDVGQSNASGEAWGTLFTNLLTGLVKNSGQGGGTKKLSSPLPASYAGVSF